MPLKNVSFLIVLIIGVAITACSSPVLPAVRGLSAPDPDLVSIEVPSGAFSGGLPELWIGVDIETVGDVETDRLLEVTRVGSAVTEYEVRAVCFHSDAQLVVPYWRGDVETSLGHPSIDCRPPQISTGQLLLLVESRMASDLRDAGVVHLERVAIGGSDVDIDFDLTVRPVEET